MGMKEENEKLGGAIHKTDKDAEELENAMAVFLRRVESQKPSFDVNPQVETFEKFQKDLREKTRGNSEEIDKLLKEVQKEFEEFQSLQIQLQRANLLNLFYELEGRGNDKEGLDENEYNLLLSRLDLDTAEKMGKFKDWDKGLGRNGNINL